MRTSLILLGICIVVLVFSDVDALRLKERSCKNSKQCGSGKCCVVPNTFKGRKRRSTEQEGTCKPYGAAGSACFVNPFQIHPWLYVEVCPCQKYLVCTGTGVNEVPIGQRGICSI